MDVKFRWLMIYLPRAGCPRRQNLISDAKSRRKCLAVSITLIAELHPRAKRARGRSPIGKEMW